MKKFEGTRKVQFPLSFEELWYAWYQRLALYSRNFGGLSGEDREEAVTDILNKAWQERHRFNQYHAVSTWMYRIARNYLLNCVRANKRYDARNARAPLDPSWPPDTGVQFQPEHNYLRKESLAHLAKAIDTLDRESKEIIHLVYQEGMRLAEVGLLCGLSEGAIKTRIHRIKGILRTHLEEEL